MALWTAAAVALIAALGGALYWAWDQGRIPGNPRALSAEAMQPAVLRHLITAQRPRQGGCLAPELASPRPEQQGQEGIAPRIAPGQFVVTLLEQARGREQDLRARQLAQMDYLAAQGLFSRMETTLLTDAGPRAARRYALTWKGWAETSGLQYGLPCFRIGESAFEAIEGFERLAQAVAGLEAWSVSYRSAVRELPAWAASEEARALFPRLRERTQPARERTVLLRGRDGWVSEGEARAQLADSRHGGADAAARYAEDLRFRASPEARDLAAARAALASFLKSEPWVRRHASACLPLRLPRGGDDRSPQLREGPVTFTYYDLKANERHETARLQMVSALHALHALEAVGFARARPTGPGSVTFGRISFKASRGVQYALPADAVDVLGYLRGACIPAGRLEVEVLALRVASPGLAHVAARGMVSEPPDWARRVAAELPALRLVLEEGVAVSGQLVYAGGAWRVSGLTPLYPEIQSHSVPAPLRRLLPLTEAAHPVVAAPAVLQ